MRHSFVPGTLNVWESGDAQVTWVDYSVGSDPIEKHLMMRSEWEVDDVSDGLVEWLLGKRETSEWRVGSNDG
ncbi:hypothetical protein [Goodfellowiella coeruleoviolacea]|uniref:hypothetical protein n=1 Tax=Goodfellowiella coeruleoviolacea TaxID=334858 RepID=UPI0020A2AED8|nr:hypothetical protein [Goodfellowiella coeruleoviolacea]